MTARELHNSYTKQGASWLINDHREIVLRALDLLAATEGSTDEIVRELWSSASRPIHLRATAALVAMRAAKEKAEAERDEATSYAKNLAEGLHRKHYAEVTQWKPLDDLLGLLTQIDNMTARLVRALDLQEKP